MKLFSLCALVLCVVLSLVGFSYAQNDDDDQLSVPDVYQLVEIPDTELKADEGVCYTFIRKTPATEKLEFRFKTTDDGFGNLFERRDSEMAMSNSALKRSGKSAEAVVAFKFNRAGRGEIEVWSNGKKTKTIQVTVNGATDLLVMFKKKLTAAEREKAFPGLTVIMISDVEPERNIYKVVFETKLSNVELSNLVNKLPEVKAAAINRLKAK